MYYPSIPPVHSFSIIKTIVTIPLRIMENSVPSQLVDTLINRLNEAERRAKLLNLEVKSIRREISELQQTATSVSTTQNRNVDPLLRLTLGSTNLGRHNPRHTILLDSLPGTSAVDSSETGKRPVDTDNSTQNKKLKTIFKMADGYVEVYTDGACENNGKPNAKAGIGVWFGEEHPLNVSKPVVGRATNNRAEIQACTEGLNRVKEHGGEKVKIYTDSEFTKNCMTKWVPTWEKNDWKTVRGQPVKNREELQELTQAVSGFKDVQWVHVDGHSGVWGNEQADRLARQGASKYRPN